MINWNNKAIEVPSARKLAYNVLFDVFTKDAYANLTLQKVMKTYAPPKYQMMSKSEKGLLTEIVYGVCRRYNYLTWIIGKLSTRPISKIDEKVTILLCIGLYQLLFLNRIPESAAVNETVNIAKQITHMGNARFVNAILRNYLRKKIQIRIPTAKENNLLHLSLTLNQPEWLIRRMIKQVGQNRTKAILEEFNKSPSVDIHSNPIKLPVNKLLEKLKFLHAEPTVIPFISGQQGIRIGNGDALFKSSLIKEGMVYIQSAASMIPASILEPCRGEAILDMCAAPGSKSINIAQLTENRARIDAWDLYEHKVNLIKQNAAKLGITCIQAEQHDATVVDEKRIGLYDRVLLDAPCSGLGVLAHKPEIRWRRSEESLKEFPVIQRKLMKTAAFYVKPEGILVYSTCTLNKEENEEVITWFLKTHPNFKLQTFNFNGKRITEGMITIWPDEYHTDGFFVARLIRSNSND